jgi:hypothetical protein
MVSIPVKLFEFNTRVVRLVPPPNIAGIVDVKPLLLRSNLDKLKNKDPLSGNVPVKLLSDKSKIIKRGRFALFGRVPVRQFECTSNEVT